MNKDKLETNLLLEMTSFERMSAHIAAAIDHMRLGYKARVDTINAMGELITSEWMPALYLERLTKYVADEVAREGAVPANEASLKKKEGIVSFPGAHADHYRLDYINRPDQIPPLSERLAEDHALLRKINGGKR